MQKLFLVLILFLSVFLQNLKAEVYTIEFDNKDIDFYSSFMWANNYNVSPIEKEYDFALTVFYKRAFQLETSSKYSEIAYNLFPESNFRLFTGIQYSYKNRFLLPIGTNINIGYPFGLSNDRIILSSKIAFDIEDTIQDISSTKDNFTIGFAIRIRFF